VCAALRPLDADVIVMPEHFRRHAGAGTLDALAADGYAIEERRFATLAFPGGWSTRADPGEGWWTLAIASRLPMRRLADVPMGKWIRDPAGARFALHVTVEVEGTPLEVVGLHTSSKLWWGSPLAHMARLRPHVRPLRDGPAILVGDFNMWGPVVAAFLPGWRRAVRARTYPRHRPHSQIDHVLVDRFVEPVAGGVGERTESDHLPLWARLRVGGAARSW
jgi:endonuclease/exonuclease/phosphatase family metal-dependent hydrolase